MDDEDLLDELEDLGIADVVDDLEYDVDYCADCGQVGVLDANLWECEECSDLFCEFCLKDGLCPTCSG